MAKSGWYVVQVETGREPGACRVIERAGRLVDGRDAMGGRLVGEVFSPRYRSRFKLHGEWHDEERQLLPGYVVAVTSEPWKLARMPRDVAGFARVLKMGETFAPLRDEERSWIERWTTEGNRVIPMSIAYKEWSPLSRRAWRPCLGASAATPSRPSRLCGIVWHIVRPG